MLRYDDRLAGCYYRQTQPRIVRTSSACLLRVNIIISANGDGNISRSIVEAAVEALSFCVVHLTVLQMRHFVTSLRTVDLVLVTSSMCQFHE